MDAFDEFVASNRSFWHRTLFSGSSDGSTLIEGSLLDEYLLHGVLKAGLIFSKIRDLKPIVSPSIRPTRASLSIIKSMCSNVVPIRRLFLFQLVRKLPLLLGYLLKLKSGADVLNIHIRGAAIGAHVYDSLLGHFHIHTVDRLTLSMKLYCVLLIVYCLAFMTAVRKYRVKLVILHDPAYICGLLFQICKVDRIECINAINLELFQMRRYKPLRDYADHYRKIEANALTRMPDEGEWLRALETYMERRVSGDLDQHDILTAYSKEKVILSKAELYREYGLRPGLPLVVVMAHAFTDAPHAYPGMLFMDYYEWLVESVSSLMLNREISFVVKEHPSGFLYGEGGILWDVMKRLGCEGLLLKKNVHTATILASADYVVTCAGTIGIEISMLGKPVILGAQPHYSGLGFTVEPKGVAEYRALLSSSIQRLPALDERQMLCAKKAAFYMFEMLNNRGESLELGGVRYRFQKGYDREAFYRKVIDENNVRLEEQRIFKLLHAFDESGESLIINWDALKATSPMPAVCPGIGRGA